MTKMLLGTSLLQSHDTVWSSGNITDSVYHRTGGPTDTNMFALKGILPDVE